MNRSLLERIARRATLRAGFERVAENRGCAGADGVSLATYRRRLETNLSRLEEALVLDTYEPFPLLRLLVPKRDGSSRQLCVPAVRDRVAQAAAYLVLRRRFEKEYEACSFGYRRGRSVRAAIERVRAYYADGYRWVVEADVDAYFDTIDHALLEARLAPLLSALRDGDRVLRLLLKWVAAQVWDGSQLYRLARGIPQGSVLSPLLANLFLDRLDETLEAAGQKLVRYADDFVILCRDRPQAEAAIALTHETLAQMRLRLDEARVTTFDDGFQFLGVRFQRANVFLPHRDRIRRGVDLFPPPLDPGKFQDPLPPA